MATASPTTASAESTLTLPTSVISQVELAAQSLGISVSEFASQVLSDQSTFVLAGNPATRLSVRDSELFLKTLDDETLQPNPELVQAAKEYMAWKNGDVK